MKYKEKQTFCKGKSKNDAQYKRAMWKCLLHATVEVDSCVFPKSRTAEKL